MKSKIVTTLALSLLMSAPAFAGKGKDCSKESNYPEVSRSEVEKLVETKSATIIDVNSKDSFSKEHVPGAIHYGSHTKDFAQQLPADHDAKIVAYCGGVKCSAWKTAAEQACKLGYTNVQHFKGGLQEWTSKHGDKTSDASGA